MNPITLKLNIPHLNYNIHYNETPKITFHFQNILHRAEMLLMHWYI